MAVWKVPRITTAARVTLTPGAGELIYDTDQQAYYGGDGATAGGIPLANAFIAREAGEALTAGQPVKIAANKLYIATSADANVVGVAMAACAISLLASAAYTGPLTLSGLTPGLTPGPVFVSATGTLTSTAPSAGYVTRVGQAISTDTLIINLAQPIHLVP